MKDLKPQFEVGLREAMKGLLDAIMGPDLTAHVKLNLELHDLLGKSALWTELEWSDNRAVDAFDAAAAADGLTREGLVGRLAREAVSTAHSLMETK